MNKITMIVCLVALSSSAFAYQEKIERNGDDVRASWTAPADVAVAARDLSGFNPIAGNFYAYSETFVTKDQTCDQFVAKIHALISDWKKYPHTNMYALSNCSGQAGQGSTTTFLYALDAWRPEAVAEVQSFLSDHRGLPFEGQTLWFSLVNKLDVKTALTLGNIKPNGNLTPVRAANAWSEFSGTDTWYPTNYAKSKVVLQKDLDVFLNWVAGTYGNDEKAPFREAIAGSNFVMFSDFFTLHLENGKTGNFWLGFGSSRRCGTQPCFAKAPRSED